MMRQMHDCKRLVDEVDCFAVNLYQHII